MVHPHTSSTAAWPGGEGAGAGGREGTTTTWTGNTKLQVCSHSILAHWPILYQLW